MRAKAPSSDRDRQRKRRQKIVEFGRKSISVTVPANRVEDIRAVAAAICDGRDVINGALEPILRIETIEIEKTVIVPGETRIERVSEPAWRPIELPSAKPWALTPMAILGLIMGICGGWWARGMF